MNKRLFIPFLLLVVVMAVSCQRNLFYEKMDTLKGEVWNVDTKLEYEFEITDSLAYYDFYINVGNTVDFETQNFYLFMDTEFPNGYKAQDTLGCILSDPYGHWKGKGVGRVKENRFLFKPNVRFPQKGVYKFTVVQAMRQEEVKGIAYFGITLLNHQENNK